MHCCLSENPVNRQVLPSYLDSIISVTRQKPCAENVKAHSIYHSFFSFSYSPVSPAFKLYNFVHTLIALPATAISSLDSIPTNDRFVSSVMCKTFLIPTCSYMPLSPHPFRSFSLAPRKLLSTSIPKSHNVSVLTSYHYISPLRCSYCH